MSVAHVARLDVDFLVEGALDLEDEAVAGTDDEACDSPKLRPHRSSSPVDALVSERRRQ